MRKTFLPFSPPDIGDEEIQEVVDALRSGWLTSGPRVRRFQEEFGAYIGAESALALSSGTAALHVALLAADVGPGDGVIVPAMTFASAAHVVEHVGAQPIVVDVEPETLNMDIASARAGIERASVRVRCIAPVHLHGHPADMAAILGSPATTTSSSSTTQAHALPASIDGVTIGGSRDPRVLTAFSFYATKNLVTGEGGMLTGPSDLVDAARRWVLHGMTQDAWRRHENGAAWRYDVDRAGFKYNLSDIQAALGLVQLKRLPEMHGRRRAIFDRYTEAFGELEAVQRPGRSVRRDPCLPHLRDQAGSRSAHDDRDASIDALAKARTSGRASISSRCTRSATTATGTATKPEICRWPRPSSSGSFRSPYTRR